VSSLSQFVFLLAKGKKVMRPLLLQFQKKVKLLTLVSVLSQNSYGVYGGKKVLREKQHEASVSKDFLKF